MYLPPHPVLFGLRTKQQHDEGVPNTDALDMFQDYFGALTPDTTEQQELKKSIAAAKAENADLSRDLEEVRRAIQSKREQMEKAREEKRLREEEEARNPKKGGKK